MGEVEEPSHEGVVSAGVVGNGEVSEGCGRQAGSEGLRGSGVSPRRTVGEQHEEVSLGDEAQDFRGGGVEGLLDISF